MRAVMALAEPRAGAASRRADRARQAGGGDARAGGDRVLSRRGGAVMLAVENIDVFYGDAQALDGVSLEVEEGAIVAIVGANGAGKTSLIRTIAGMNRPGARRDPLSRQRHRGLAEPPGVQSRHRAGGGGPPGVSDAHGRRKPRHGRDAAARQGRSATRTASACWRCFRACRSGCGRRPARCRAASSRCWRSAAA